MVWDVRFAASDLLAHAVSHGSPPDHPRIGASTHTHAHTHSHPSDHATPSLHSTTPDYPPKPSRTVLPAARRLNLPGALHEHESMSPVCAAPGQSDRVTPRPFSLSRLELLPAAAPSLDCLRAPVSPKSPLRRPSQSCLSCLYHLLAHRIIAAHHHQFYYCPSNAHSPTALVA